MCRFIVCVYLWYRSSLRTGFDLGRGKCNETGYLIIFLNSVVIFVHEAGRVAIYATVFRRRLAAGGAGSERSLALFMVFGVHMTVNYELFTGSMGINLVRG